MENIPYEAIRNPNLPWGYWLQADENGYPPLRDEHGNPWDSVRDCLWRGRLRMADSSRWDVEDQLEFLLALLAAIDRRVVHIEEKTIDLFQGAWALHTHYSLWLDGAGLTDGGLTGSLTLEGRAILVMLASTRSVESAPVPIGLPVLAPRVGLDRGETREERERVLASQEAFACDLPFRFVRASIMRKPGIKLTGIEIGDNIPLTRVLWSMCFPDDHARDRLFAWLSHRLDRWQEWGALVGREGAQALSDHLLQLAFADLPALAG